MKHIGDPTILNYQPRSKTSAQEYLMLIGWLIFANLGLWCQYFNQYQIFHNLHQLFMMAVVVISWVAGMMMYMEAGGDRMSGLHIGLGLTVLLLLLAISLTGILASKIRSTPRVPPVVVTITNKIHRFGGWLLLLTTFFQMVTTLNNPQLIIVIFVDITSYLGFYILKYRFKSQAKQTSLQPSASTNNYNQKHLKNLKQIKNICDLAYLRQDYFIFEDKIYSLQNILSCHPGGRDLIQSIKCREVDRYIYGTQSIQFSSVIHSHYETSIKTVGPPLAKLYNPSPYPNLPQISQTLILQLTKQCKNNIMYTLYLRCMIESDQLTYTGYTQLCQLGKYYTVNIYNHVTRLYNCVNFLQYENLEFMGKIMESEGLGGVRLVKYNGEVHEVVNQELMNLPAIPLFLKVYDKGAFSSLVLSGNFQSQIKISRPRGRGLALHEVSPGRVVIFAAGTGLNPFCDLIDLIFKQALLSQDPQNTQLTQKILKQNPILQTNPFQNLKFTIYIAAPQLNYLHPITTYQLNYLAQKINLKVQIRTKTQNDRLYFIYPYLNKVTERFESFVQEEVGSQGENVSYVYVCGLPRFNKSMGDELRRMQVQPYKYKIL